MIADTTFLSDLLSERQAGRPGPAARFLARHRGGRISTTIITAGEVAVRFPDKAQAEEWLHAWTIYRLHPDVAFAAADVDRELIRAGSRLGENDNWIAGFARYHRQPVISRDAGFDRVPGLRRVAY